MEKNKGGLSAIRAGSGHWEWIAEAVVMLCHLSEGADDQSPDEEDSAELPADDPGGEGPGGRRVRGGGGGGGHQQEGEEAAGGITHFQLHNASSGEQLHPIMKEQPALRHRGHPCRIPARHGDGAVGGWRL